MAKRGQEGREIHELVTPQARVRVRVTLRNGDTIAILLLGPQWRQRLKKKLLSSISTEYFR
jgi:hypothetical protein